MKTQRRHELQKNVLADWINHQLTAVEPFLKYVALGALVLAIVGVAAAFLMRQRNAAREAAWEDYYAALAERDADRLRTVADNHPGTRAALWAKESEADLELTRGLEALFADRNEAREALRRARNRFSEIVEQAGADEKLVQRAWYGLGQIHEAQNELPKAREYYEKVKKAAGDAPLGKLAQQRLEVITDPEVEKWYNWFARQKPTPPATPTGLPGGTMPPLDLGNLSDRPDIDLPGEPGPPPPAAASEDATPPAATDAAPTADAAPPADNPPEKSDDSP